MIVRKITHEDTVLVELPASQWLVLEDHAKHQAEKCQNWTIVNILSDAFRAAKEGVR